MRYSCITGVIQFRLLLRTPAADLVDRQAGGAVQHTPQERLPGRRRLPPPSSACLPQRSRSPPGPELSDLVTPGLPREDALGRGERRLGGEFPVERSLRRQGRLVLIRLFVAQAFKVPGSTIHVARGATRTAKVWRWCCTGRGDGGEQAGGPSWSPSPSRLRAQHAGCTACAWTSRTPTLMSRAKRWSRRLTGLTPMKTHMWPLQLRGKSNRWLRGTSRTSTADSSGNTRSGSWTRSSISTSIRAASAAPLARTPAVPRRTTAAFIGCSLLLP